MMCLCRSTDDRYSLEDIVVDQDIDGYIRTSEDALFHYTKTSTAIEHILHTKRFKLSVLNNSNDPQEYKDMLLSISGSSLGPDKTFELLGRANRCVNRMLKDEGRRMCFCTNDKPILILRDGCSIEDEHACSEGWSKSRMWSQYAENHYGVCLVLSKERLAGALDERKCQIAHCRLGPVKYLQPDDDSGEALCVDGNRAEAEGVEEHARNHVVEHCEELFFRKHIDYRDEAEFKVVVFDPDKKLEYLDVSSLIKCVIVGERTPEAYIPLVDQMCSELSIEFRIASWTLRQPSLRSCSLSR